MSRKRLGGATIFERVEDATFEETGEDVLFGEDLRRARGSTIDRARLVGVDGDDDRTSSELGRDEPRIEHRSVDEIDVVLFSPDRIRHRLGLDRVDLEVPLRALTQDGCYDSASRIVQSDEDAEGTSSEATSNMEHITHGGSLEPSQPAFGRCWPQVDFTTDSPARQGSFELFRLSVCAGLDLLPPSSTLRVNA